MASATSAASGQSDAESVLQSLLEFADVFEFNNGLTRLGYEQILTQGLQGVSSAKAESRAAMGEVTVGKNAQSILWALGESDSPQSVQLLAETINSNGTSGSSNVQRAAVSPLTDEKVKEIRFALASVKTAVGKLDEVITDGLLYGCHLSTLPQLLSYDQFKMHTGCEPEVFQYVVDNGWVNPHSLNSRVSRMHLALSTSLSDYL